MSPLALGLLGVLAVGLGGVALHHQLHRARVARIRVEADAFGGRLDG